MCCRRQLAVLVVVALIEYACAAPGANNTQPTDEKLNDPRPVRERFPHAVLFANGCGGTILSPSWILTAAHCTQQMAGLFVVAGPDDTYDNTGVARSIKRSIIHPKFTVGPYWLNPAAFNIRQLAATWDFLLVELDVPLPLNGKTMTAAKLDDQPSLPEGLDVSYAGYGASYHGGPPSTQMHVTELTLQSNQVCSTLEQFSSQDMLCAKGRPPRYDFACNGDSGNGLVDETGRLVGVLSWGQNDLIECKNGNLVVFSRVSSVRDWIKQVIWDLSGT